MSVQFMCCEQTLMAGKPHASSRLRLRQLQICFQHRVSYQSAVYVGFLGRPAAKLINITGLTAQGVGPNRITHHGRVVWSLARPPRLEVMIALLR